MRKGAVLVELLVALALLGGVAYLVSRLAVQGVSASRGVVEGAQAAGNLSDGLAFLRSRLEATPIPLFLAGDASGFAAVRRTSATPLPLASAAQGQDTLALLGSVSLAQGELLLLYGPQGDVTVVRVVSVRASGGNTEVQVSCNLPYSLADGLRVYRGALLYAALGSGTGVQGADPKTLYWSEDGIVWRPVVGGLAQFQVAYRYRRGGVGAVLDDPQGFRPGGYPLPYLEVSGAGYYLTELVLYARPETGERDFQAIASLGQGDAAGRVRRVVGCALPSSTPRGVLEVQVAGLPQGTAARVRVSGPRGYAQELSASAELTVPPGSYAVAAEEVWAGSELYTAQVSGSPAQVADGGRAVVRVDYRPAVQGTLRVEVSGLPQGAEASVGVQDAASGTPVAQRLLASGTHDFRVPAGRAYDVSGAEVAFGGHTYRVQGANPVRSAPVPSSGVTTVRLPYYCATCPATLRVDVSWEPAKPAGAQASIAVYRPDGSQTLLQDSATLDTTAGRHTVSASSILGSDGFTYTPTVSPASLDLAPGGTGVVSVVYRASQGALRVRVEGLPAGFEGEWSLAGPQGNLGFYRGLSYTHILPVGTYTVLPQDVTVSSGVVYRGTATPSPVTLGPAETKDVVITYQEQRMARFKVVLFATAISFHSDERGPAVVLNGRVYEGSPQGVEYLLPEGTYTLGALGYQISLGQATYGTYYDTTSATYTYYPCDYPTQTCSGQALVPGSSLNLQGTGVRTLVARVNTSNISHIAPQVRVVLRFPSNLAGRTVTVPYEARAMNLDTGAVSTAWEPRQAQVRLDSSGSGSLEGVWIQFGTGPAGGLDLRFGNVTVDGTTYYPRVQRFAVSGQAAMAGLVRTVAVDYATVQPSVFAFSTYDLFHFLGGPAYSTSAGNWVTWQDQGGLRVVSAFAALPRFSGSLRFYLERDAALGEFALSNSNLGLLAGGYYPSALHTTTSVPGTAGTFSLSPSLDWRYYDGSRFLDHRHSDYNLTNFGSGDLLYIQNTSCGSSACPIRWIMNPGFTQDGYGVNYVELHVTTVPSLRGSSSGSSFGPVALPPGNYTLRLRGRPGGTGSLQVSVYGSDGNLRLSRSGSPCSGGLVCQEVSFSLALGERVDIRAGY